MATPAEIDEPSARRPCEKSTTLDPFDFHCCLKFGDHMRKRILVYKRTHTGDPDRLGCFGCWNCKQNLRHWDFAAAIGVGGISAEPRRHRIEGKITWIGDGARKTVGTNNNGQNVLLVTFDRFRIDDSDGVDLRSIAPLLAKRMLDANTRHVMDSLSAAEHAEAVEILKMAAHSLPSKAREGITPHGLTRRPASNRKFFCNCPSTC